MLRPLLDLADAKIEDLGERRIGFAIDQEDVVWLEIAVNDARVMRLRQAAHDLDDDALRFGWIEQRLALEARGQQRVAIEGVSPRNISITMNATPSSVKPASKISTMCGLSAALAAWASRVKRAAVSRFLAYCGARILIATRFLIVGLIAS